MKNIIQCVLILSFCFAKVQAKGTNYSDTLSNKKKRREQKQIVLLSMTNIGMEVLQPSLRNNFTSQGYMTGPTMQIGGFFEMGVLKGMAYKIDRPIVTTATSMFYFGVKYHKLLTRSRSLNFGPILGLRFMLGESKDPYYVETDLSSSTFGVGAYGGAFLKVGPITVNAKYHIDGNINFAPGSNFSPLALYPSVGIAFSPLQILMNPQEFSHTALSHWITDFESYTSTKREYRGSGEVYDVTRYSATWKDNYGNKTMNCKDVQPFFFLGPRISCNIRNINKTDLLNSYGLNMGYRRGALFLNGFIEKENIYFAEPFGRSYDTSEATNNNFKGRLDGVFTNSLKYGGQIGLEWVNWALSKDFVYKESRVKKATSNFSFITFAGYGKVHFGDLKFNSDSGLTSYQNYLNKNPDNSLNPEKNVLLTKTDATFLNFGAQIGIGAVALNIEYTIYDKSYKKLNGYKLGVSYNIPISRAIRAIKVANLKRKANKTKK